MLPATLPLTSVGQALRQSPLPPIRSLAIDETEFEVTLTGQVHSYYFKQLAQETIRPLLGQRRLINRIVVDPLS